MTRANSFEQLDELLIPILLFAQIHHFFNNLWSNLHLQKFLVIIYQTDDCFFGSDVVLRISVNSMVEVQVNPLTHVKFILVVTKPNRLYHVVGSFAHHHNLVSGTHLGQLTLSTFKGEVDDMN